VKISNVTISEVAAAAGVGESTVSRVLRNEGSFSAKSRERVVNAAKQLGYVPNRIAGSLASAGSQLVAVIVPSLTNIVFADLLYGAGEVLDAANHRGVFGVTDYDPLKEERLIASFLEYRPTAILLAGLEHTEDSIRMLRASKCRIVEMLDIAPDPIANLVGFSNFEAGRAAARLLIDHGYTRVGYIGHDLDADRRAAKRLEGFRQEIAASTVELADMVVSKDKSSVRLGRQGLAALLARNAAVEAVYFSNDDMAIGGYFHCLAAGIGVPEDLGIVGHNGLDIGAELPMPLSTVRTPRIEIGKIAAQMAIGASEATRVDLGFELVVGATIRNRRSP
jgi:LacI family gluconate utilization system Gnt-I transcriptional repressor